jgi:hypothetical protein
MIFAFYETIKGEGRILIRESMWAAIRLMA